MINNNLLLVPGDLDLNRFEEELGTTWISALGGVDRAVRLQTAVFRYIDYLVQKYEIEVVFLDLGPNLGALNRSLLVSSDYFIVPVAPDLFSIRATENLGKRIVQWSNEWQAQRMGIQTSITPIPKGNPTFLGYVVQQHNTRNTNVGTTRGWQIFTQRLPNEIQNNIINRLLLNNQVYNPTSTGFEIGKIPNLHSLIPYSMEALKPVYECTKDDGLTGEHITKAKNTIQYYQNAANLIKSLYIEK